LQLETAVKVDPVQDGLPHETEVDACVQAPPPLHTPVLPHGGAAAHPGSAVLAGTLAHAPALPVTLQAWQVAQAATPQHTPLVQKPDPHSFALPQALPLPFLGMQLPPGAVQ